MTRYVPSYTEVAMTLLLLQIGEVKVPLCMVDLAQTIEEWKDIQSIKVDDQVSADQKGVTNLHHTGYRHHPSPKPS